MQIPSGTQSNFKYFLAGTLVVFSLSNTQYSESTLLPLEFHDVDSCAYQKTVQYPMPQYEYSFATQNKISGQPDKEPLVDFPVFKKLKVRIGNVSALEFVSVENTEGFI